jgi:hypothetical protein
MYGSRIWISWHDGDRFSSECFADHANNHAACDTGDHSANDP